jgi:adenine-specific DNA methylase
MGKRNEQTSYLDIDISKYVKQKREACRFLLFLLNFIKKNKIDIKTIADVMAGCGIVTEYLLKIDGVEQLILNDLAEDCCLYLKKKFKNQEKIAAILNQDFFELDLMKQTDLVFVDFNNFTWNKEGQASPFLAWVERNKKCFSYLLYCDSFYYSLKFLKDKTQLENKYQDYLNQAEKNLKMKLIMNYVHKSKNCSWVLLKNK